MHRQVPFTGLASAVLLGHVLKPPPRMTEVVAELPPVLDTPVLAMLAKDRAQRPASAGAALQQLEHAAQAAGLTLAPLELPRSQLRQQPPGQPKPTRMKAAAVFE
jgi:serine/threonine-protein kinase